MNEANIKLFFSFVNERQNIWYKRFVLKQPYPWTADPILKEFKFTNVFRVLDPGTQFVFDNILNQDATDLDILFNLFIYRIFNKPETHRVNGFVPIQKFNLEVFQSALQGFRKSNTVFTNAFMVTGNIHLDTKDKVKKYCRVIQEIQANLPNVYHNILAGCSMKQCHEALQSFTGIGDFLAYQIMLDAMYTRILPYSEDEWSVTILGCAKGLACVFPDVTEDKLLDSMIWLRQHQKDYLDEFFSLGAFQLPKGYIYDGTSISLSNIENCLCEFSKYMRARDGTGQPKNKFRPNKTSSTIVQQKLNY